MVGQRHPLARAIQTFERHERALLEKGLHGQWALVHDDRLVAVYPSRADCLRSGYRQFGNAPFLVREIVEDRPPWIARPIVPRPGLG